MRLTIEVNARVDWVGHEALTSLSADNDSLRRSLELAKRTPATSLVGEEKSSERELSGQKGS